MSEEKLTAIIAIRVTPSYKQWLKETAEECGESLSDLILDLIEENFKQPSSE